jgi:hypothetical protein
MSSVASKGWVRYASAPPSRPLAFLSGVTKVALVCSTAMLAVSGFARSRAHTS